MFEFHSPIQRACGCLAILSSCAAFSGSVLRRKFAFNITFASGSTNSFAPFSGLAVTGGGTGGSVMGASGSGCELECDAAEDGDLTGSEPQAVATTRAAPSARMDVNGV